MNDCKHFILQVGDGENFVKGNPRCLWYIKLRFKTFIEKAKEGDKLWFIKKQASGDLNLGKIIAVADFVSKNKITNEDNEIKKTLNFTGEQGGVCNIVIHYTKLYNLTALNLYLGQKYQTTIVEYDNVKERLLIDLPHEYEKIVFYSQITNRM
jgi:hypothetical protein